MRTRRAVPTKGLVVVVSAVGGVVLVWIGWLSVQVYKLCLCKALNGLVLLSCSLRNLSSLTLTLSRCLLPSDSSPQLAYIVLWKRSSSVGDLRTDLSRKVTSTPDYKANPISIGQLTVTLEALC
jgi:hypothetical protein